MINEHEPTHTPEEELGETVHMTEFIREQEEHEARKKIIAQTKEQFWDIIEQMEGLADSQEELEINVWKFALETKKKLWE